MKKERILNNTAIKSFLVIVLMALAAGRASAQDAHASQAAQAWYNSYAIRLTGTRFS
jgi:hypothetical protein